MKSGLYLALAMAAASLVGVGCSRGPDEAEAVAASSSTEEALPPIERYRTVLASVTASQQQLSLKTAAFNEGNWSAVSSEALVQANQLQGSIEGLLEFDEAAAAASTLRLHVASLQRRLQHLSADNWQAVLPDLLLLNESIRSDMDELTDLAAVDPLEEPDHDHSHDPLDEL